MDALDTQTMTHYLDVYLVPWGIRLAMALVIFFVGRWLAGVATRMAKRLMARAKVDAVLIEFLASIAHAVLMVTVGLAALDQLGVNTTSLLAVLGAAGLAVGLALKDSLANFAAGVMLILFGPFKAGDFIEAAGTSGVVEKVRIFSTLMRSPDNREITVPNSAIFSGTIVNVSARPTRRIDLIFSIGYDDDIRRAKELIEEAMAEDARILADPAPALGVADLGESSVDLFVRPWVRSTDFLAVRSDLLEKVKQRFDADGISIPYPQRDVHLYPAADAAGA